MEKSIQKSFIALFITIFLVVSLPLLGTWTAGRPLLPYLAFPPATHMLIHPDFSLPMFLGYTFVILLFLAPFIKHFFKVWKNPLPIALKSKRHPFPWWGYGGLLFGILSWIIAWNRFTIFEKIQPHTFTPLWLAYIITVNALTFRRSGRCIMLDRPRVFGLAFVLSAFFWWLFEYLNRFVRNWYYIGAEFGPWEYFWYATLPFATVLPAFISTREWLLSFNWPKKYLKDFQPIQMAHPHPIAWIALIMAGICLAFIGIYPDHFFAFLWIAPLLLMLALQGLLKIKNLFTNLTEGDWTLVIASALAALICGFFWEMWNFHSLAKWKYQIPFVHDFLIFEMPILGYAGYLPFGLECGLIADFLSRVKTGQS